MSTLDYATLVPEALNHALVNGYDLKDWAAIAIACDLIDRDQDCEGAHPDDLLPHVNAWLASRRS